MRRATNHRASRPRQEAGLVKKTVIVTVVAFVTLNVLVLLVWTVWFGGAAAVTIATAPDRSPGRANDYGGGLSIPVSAREREVMDEQEARRKAKTPGVEDDETALIKVRALIVEVQRDHGEAPTGTITTMRTVNVVKARLTGDRQRRALLLCTDDDALVREALDAELSKIAAERAAASKPP